MSTTRRVLTWNTVLQPPCNRWRYMMNGASRAADDMVRYILALDPLPDAILWQELADRNRYDQLQRGLAHIYPHWTPFMDDQPDQPEGCVVCTRVPIVHMGYQRWPEEFGSEAQGIVYAITRDQCAYVCIHMSPAIATIHLRMREIVLARDVMARVATEYPQCAIFAGGDFNTEATSPEFEGMRRVFNGLKADEGRIDNTLASYDTEISRTEPSSTWYACGYYNLWCARLAGSHLDYLWCFRHGRAWSRVDKLAETIGKSHASDHMPLYTDFRLHQGPMYEAPKTLSMREIPTFQGLTTP